MERGTEGERVIEFECIYHQVKVKVNVKKKKSLGEFHFNNVTHIATYLHVFFLPFLSYMKQLYGLNPNMTICHQESTEIVQILPDLKGLALSITPAL